MSRAGFIQAMNTALGTSLPASHRPTPVQLEDYFRTFRPQNATAALRAFRAYTSSFYVHVAHTQAGPSGNVSYPGGSCNQWSEVFRQQVSHRHVIDCEGFSFLAATLLQFAGFAFEGYQVCWVLSTQSGQLPSSWHIYAVLTRSDGGQRVFIGSPDAFTTRYRVNEATFGVNDAPNVETTPVHATALAAIQEAQQVQQQHYQSQAASTGTGRIRSRSVDLAPLRGRRGSGPSVRRQ